MTIPELEDINNYRLGTFIFTEEEARLDSLIILKYRYQIQTCIRKISAFTTEH